jgi:protocatechuate 3,4-dioxygenase beta subunit
MRKLSTFVSVWLLILQAGAAQTAPDARQLPFKISGTVVDQDSGSPLEGAIVAIAPVEGRANARFMRTGQDGRFSFENVNPGKYSLTAQRKGYLGQAFEQHDQYSTAIAVGPKLKSEDLLFRLPLEASVSGKIYDEANEAVRGASVMLFDLAVHDGRKPPAEIGLQQTNDEGAYRFSHLLPGRYIVAVSAHPWYAQNPAKYVNENRDNRSGLPDNSKEVDSVSDLDVTYPTTFYLSATDPGAATPIALSRGENFVCDIALQPVPALHLVMQLPDSDQPGGRWPNLMLRQGIFGAVNANVHSQMHRGGDGFEITGLAPGHYTLGTDVFDGNHSSHSSQEIDVSRDGRIDAKAASGPGEISGHITFESGFVVTSQLFVQLRDLKTQQGMGMPVSPTGDFKLEGVAPGTYDVVIMNAPAVTVKSIIATGANATGHKIEIKDATPVQLQLTVSQGKSSIYGLAMREKNPQAGVMVLLIPEDAANNRDLFRRDQSDSDGSFTLRSILPGKYTLLAIERGWELEWSNPAVLRPYLSKGIPINIGTNEKYKIDVSVQPK